MQNFKLIAALTILFLFGVSGAKADVIYEEEITGGASAPTMEKRLVHLKGDLLKEETFRGQEGELIFVNFDKDWVWVGDKRTKTNTQGPWAVMSGRLMRDHPRLARQIKATGEKKEVLGYITEKYLVKEEGEGLTVDLEIYIEPDLLGTEEVKKFEALFWQKMGWKSEYRDSWRNKIKGFPLLIIKKEKAAGGAEKITTTRVLSFKDVLLDRRDFEAPLLFK